MNTFKLQRNDGEKQTLATIGVVAASLELRANAPDSLSFEVDEAFDSSGAFAYGDKVRLWETVGDADVCRFVGEVLELPALADARTGSARRYVARSYLDRLSRIQYTQKVSAYGSGDSPTISSYDDACVVLGRHRRSPFSAATTGQQIADILDYAAGLSGGAFPCSRDTTAWDAGFGIPCDQRENVSCWEAILCMLRWMPDRVLWCDYAGGNTKVCLKAASSLSASTVAAAGGTLGSVSATPRHDLALPGVNVYFRRVDSVDGSNRERRYSQHAGSYTDPLAANFFIDLEGGSVTHVSQRIETLAYPTMGDNSGFRSWLELKIPWLGDTTYTVDAVSRGGSHGYSRELVSGALKKWMHVSHEEETIDVTVSYVTEDANTNLVDRATVVLPVHVTSTNATSGTRRATASYDSGESPPSGLADGIYAAWHRLHWDGSLSTDLGALGAWSSLPAPGALLNVSDGPAALASMNAVVQSARVDLADGSVEVSFGTCRALEADGLTAIYRALRGRRHAWKRSLDDAGSGSADETGTGETAFPQHGGGTESPAFARSGLAVRGPGAGSGAPTHSFSMKPEEVDFQTSGETAAAQAFKAREVRVIVEEGGALKAKWAQVLCGAPYGAAQDVGGGGGGGVPSQADTNTTLGDGTEGSATAGSTTWTADGTKGLVEWYVSRVAYFDTATTPVLYAFLRKRTVAADGRLVSVSGETRVVVDTPVSISIPS